jgi:Holliday junction DNA helicase RuvA
VLELRDKLPEASMAAAPVIPTINAVEEDVLSALLNLGYQRPAAEKVMASAVKEGEAKSFDQLFRAALGRLSK